MQVIDLHLYVKCHSFTGLFHTLCLCKSLPGFSIRVLSQMTLIDLDILGFPRKIIFGFTINTGAVSLRCSDKKVCWKNKANLQENNHAEVDLNKMLQCNFIEIADKQMCFLLPKFNVFFQNTFL